MCLRFGLVCVCVWCVNRCASCFVVRCLVVRHEGWGVTAHSAHGRPWALGNCQEGGVAAAAAPCVEQVSIHGLHVHTLQYPGCICRCRSHAVCGPKRPRPRHPGSPAHPEGDPFHERVGAHQCQRACAEQLAGGGGVGGGCKSACERCLWIRVVGAGDRASSDIPALATPNAFTAASPFASPSESASPAPAHL